MGGTFEGGDYVRKFLDNTNFRERLVSSVFLVALIIPLVLLWDAKGFRLFLVFMGTIATFELVVATRDRILSGILGDARLVLTELILFLVSILAALFVLSQIEIFLGLVAAISSDVFAYFAGKLCRNKVFITKPFPKVSPRKTWEGIIGGCVGTIVMTLVAMKLLGHFDLRFLLFAPVAAVFGDWLESLTKRIIDIKDSNEILLRQDAPILGQVEKLMSGQGGYADRIDSWAAVFTMILWFKLMQ